jgi:hypothetical protein
LGPLAVSREAAAGAGSGSHGLGGSAASGAASGGNGLGGAGYHPAPRGARLRVLLAALLINANIPVSADMLAEAVWDGASPPAAVDTLRSYVRRLRRELGAEGATRIVARDPGYLIRVADDELDLIQFDLLCRWT